MSAALRDRHLGLQHHVIKTGEATGLPLNEVTLPQHLKKLGYETHMIGKWHLGYQTKEYTPTYRGFDSYLGYYSGFIGYYDHTILDDSFLPTNLPLFLYLAHLAPHYGNHFKPQEAPPKVISKFKYIKDIPRRIYAEVKEHSQTSTVTIQCMVITQMAKFRHGSPHYVSGWLGHPISHASKSHMKNIIYNYSLADFVGGTSTTVNAIKVIPDVSASVHRSLCPRYEVYVSLGGDPRHLGPIDGFNMWDALVEDSPSPRTGLLQNMDPVLGTSAFRLGDLKIISGKAERGFDSWYGPSGLEGFDGPATFEGVFKNGSVVKDVLKETGMWIAENPRDTYERLRIKCQQPPPENFYDGCKPSKNPCLFNITDDPCEYKNIADQNPEVVAKMMDIINMYKAESMEPQSKPSDPRSDPMCHDFLVVPWLDPEYYSECDYVEDSTIEKESQ
ncbi:Arylsulfatase J [Araneus ventricosus]|uniref:Arylsulfatase J n=1 Tax=Araneus ventricosus TaxID=182803 RepID=A0A4Y2G6S2_ARAVE|nr:Arylsulfatase J [Araneus ventricosus]